MPVQRSAIYARRRTIALTVAAACSIFGLWRLGRTLFSVPEFVMAPPPLELINGFQPTIEETQTTIRPGEVISTVLQRLAVDPATSARLTTDIRPTFDLARIHGGRPLAVWHRDGEFHRLRYEIDADRFLEASRRGDGSFMATLGRHPVEVKRETVEIRIATSLYEAILGEGERPELADTLAGLFECSVDFNRDIQPQDRVKVWIEKKFRPDGGFRYGDILAAELHNNGKTTRILRFQFPDGRIGYFHPDGKSVRTLFIRSPLPFMRVTSRFGMRSHPIFSFSARHNGVDLGAPTGTVVRSTASGVVQQVGFDRSRGRFILIRHPNGYTTHYYHLRGSRSGIRSGSRVQQGELVGYVGSTGWSSGPHLHYGISRHGRFLNPLRIDAPREPSLPAQLLPGLQEMQRATDAVFAPVAPLPLPLTPPSIPSWNGQIQVR